MGKENPDKKSFHSEKSTRGKPRKRGRGRGSGVPLHHGGRIEQNPESEGFHKRLLQSNWSRYDDPEEDASSANGDDIEEQDETTDFEYIKTHTTSASSHFQFQEEKEWQEQLQTNKQVDLNFFDLNLNQLAADLDSVDIFEKLCLQDLNNDVAYSVKNLKSGRLPSSENSKVLSSDTTEIKVPPWNYSDAEKYALLRKRKKGALTKHSDLKEVVLAECEAAGAVKYGISSNEHSSDKKHIEINEEDGDTSTKQEISTSMCPTADTREITLINCNEARSGIEGTFKENDDILDHLLESTNSEPENLTDQIVKNELDLDLLLEADYASEAASFLPKDNVNAEHAKVEKDFDEWLDDMLE